MDLGQTQRCASRTAIVEVEQLRLELLVIEIGETLGMRRDTWTWQLGWWPPGSGVQRVILLQAGCLQDLVDRTAPGAAKRMLVRRDAPIRTGKPAVVAVGGNRRDGRDGRDRTHNDA